MPALAVSVAGVLEGGLLDRLVRRGWVAELERAADELRPAREGAGVDQRLVVLLVHVHVPDVEDHRRQGEERRDEQREEHGDLSPLAAAAVAARPPPPFPLHPSSPRTCHCAFWTR